MTRIGITTLFTAFLLFLPLVFADVPEEQKAEVQHLIDYLAQSGCSMIRNGKSHSAVKGVKHIQKKYDYFRDDISSTEEFIEYSATKSTRSDKYYVVECPGQEPVLSRDWLLAELAVYRKS